MEPLKNLILITDDETSLNWKAYQSQPVIDNIGRNINVLSVEYDVPELMSMTTLSNTKNPQIGDVFVKNPFKENVYVPLNEARRIFIKDKFHALFRVAVQLGATHAFAKVKIRKIEERSHTVNGDIKFCEIKSDVKFKDNRQEELNESLQLESESTEIFELNLQNYDKALELVRYYGMENDSEMMDLLDTRNPKYRVDTKNDFIFETSYELNTNMDIAFNLSYMLDVFKLHADFNETVKYKESMFFEYHIDY